MRGIGLVFTAYGAYFQFKRRVQGFPATVQNALVNIATNRGSDPCFPERGTNLQRDGVRGRMFSSASAQQSADFASLHTTAFSRMSGGDALQRFQLRVRGLKGDRVSMEIAAEGPNGETVGNIVAL